MSHTPPRTPSLLADPQNGLSNVFNDKELAMIVADHNNIMAPAYKTTIPEPTGAQKAASFDNFCRLAIVPGFKDRPEVFIPIQPLGKDDLKTILWMLENADIHSDFAWIPVAGNTTALHLSIRDNDNQHIIRHGKPAPVSVIATRQNALIAQQKLAEFLETPNPILAPQPTRLPNIDILETENKGLYVPITNLDKDQRELLMARFIEQKLQFRYYPSPSQGEVFVVPYEDWSGLQQVQAKIEIENESSRDTSSYQYHLDRATENVRLQLANLAYKPLRNE